MFRHQPRDVEIQQTQLHAAFGPHSEHHAKRRSNVTNASRDIDVHKGEPIQRLEYSHHRAKKPTIKVELDLILIYDKRSETRRHLDLYNY